MLRTAELEYELPPDSVATTPAIPRDSARLLVVRRSDPQRVEHRVVRELAEILNPGDLMVFNRTRVLPARFVGRRTDTGAGVQGLYLGPGPDPSTWVVLLKMRRFRAGVEVKITSASDGPSPVSNITLTLVRPVPTEPGAWTVRAAENDRPLSPERTLVVLERVGRTPLPPYIISARKRQEIAPADADDRLWYQTVYPGEAGSVAAPTAGLHFTPDLLDRLARAGVGRADVVLHVGTGTFRAVESEHVEEHAMHEEWCAMPAETRAAVAHTRRGGGRVISVGTTSARTLESFAGLDEAGDIPDHLNTRLLITPGYAWQWTDGILTNFHLPRSTLMALVAAMLPGGVGHLKRLYAEAIKRGYRFYSYGDAMLVLP